MMNISQQNSYQRLSSSCIDYIAHSVVGESQVEVEFAGQFNQRDVVWFATIRCLPADKKNKQYIHVQLEENQSPRVEIGLPLERIDEPAILKSILMIRYYKNLRVGMHEFSGRDK
ncbi:MAG: hypothetical protein P8Y28_04080 [Gammaproteobacteria bacterium]